MTGEEQETGERLAVQRMIAADAAAIFRVLCDPEGYAGSSGPGVRAEHPGYHRPRMPQETSGGFLVPV